ncbi:glycine--tRNA ligase subunit beta [Desulfosarcina sp. OttesenSCG-928-A07]|nr:glycine--tRNA ligase subunit beta [Desulfosarcina sp. OttesenSCG-928-G17]MDL2329782.1 glycine--tRNA ligase subunit beta [Desulfosarcina sp. OttesenSCG-928-A07]
MKPLLIEIGAEEIPAGYIQPALDAMAQNLLKRLDAARIGHGSARTWGTPRRLAVMVENVADKQETLETHLTGPPEKAGFDAGGKPTLAALKFAEKAGVEATALTIAETEKGRYLSARVVSPGQATPELLKTILPEVILATPFPKTMRWADLSISFARPIQTLVALYGADIVPFTLGGRIKSGRDALGHLFMHPEKVAVSSPEAYVSALSQAHVVVDIKKRREMTAAEVDRAAAQVGGKVLADEDLLDIVTNLVEIPVATAGRFDDEFLEVPQEILITAMREHQKYFSVVDKDGRLMPGFVAVNNTRPRDMDLVTAGHQRVLRARLSDARYFYTADRRTAMETWVEKLKTVLFQAKLGSVQDKVGRVKILAGWLAEAIYPEDKEKAVRAAHLCKADLVSQVVGEFPTLQGIMGRIYALKAGEPDDVAAAIEEHYRPTHSGGKLPETQTGALLSIADKIDTLCGCFAVGLIPTGAADPYALRRQSIGLLQILRSRHISLSLEKLVEKGVFPFSGKSEKPAHEIVEAVLTFIRNRFSRMLVDEGNRKDRVAAVMAASADQVTDVDRRVAALERFKDESAFDALAAAIKRVENILKKAPAKTDVPPNPALFTHEAENILYDRCRTIAQQVSQCMDRGDPDSALSAVVAFKDPVDGFFADVMVMDNDPAVRQNRLALLAVVSAVFGRIADFSQLSG